MYGIAERIENGRNIERNGFVVAPNVRHRQRNVFGECARPVYANALSICAEMPASRQAVPAAAAYDVPFTADNLAGIEVSYIRANLNDAPDKFVPDHHRHRNRLLRPVIPFVNVDIGA